MAADSNCQHRHVTAKHNGNKSDLVIEYTEGG